MKNKNANAECYRVTVWGLLANILLSLGKLFGGIFGRSSALIADALHSASDIITDIVTIAGLYFSKMPPDERHQFGHGKYETFTALIVGIAVLGTGVWLAYSGIVKTVSVFRGEILARPGMITMVIAFVSIVIKELLFRVTIVKARKHNSSALTANAWHHRSDAFSSIGALLGISGAYFLGSKWIVLDPIAAVVVSLFVIYASISIIRSVSSELLEESLSQETEDEIIAVIKSVEGVGNPHNLRTRCIGPNYAIDIHIEVSAQMTVLKSHEIATKVEQALYVRYGEETVVSVHIEPLAIK